LRKEQFLSESKKFDGNALNAAIFMKERNHLKNALHVSILKNIMNLNACVLMKVVKLAVKK